MKRLLFPAAGLAACLLLLSSPMFPSSVVARLALGRVTQSIDSIAINPVTGLAYVPIGIPASIAVIDTTTNTLVTNIPLSDSPISVAVNSVTNMIYANTGKTTSSVQVIDGMTNTVVASIPTATQARGIAVDPVLNRVYALYGKSSQMFVIDGNTNTVVTIVSTAFSAISVAVDAVSNLVYVTNQIGDVLVVDGTTDVIVDTIMIPTTGMGVRLQGIAVDHTFNRLYVTDAGNGNLAVADATTFQLLDVIGQFLNPAGVAVDLTSHTIYVVTGLQSGAVSIVDPTTLKVTGTVNVKPILYDIAEDPNTGNLYRTAPNKGILVIAP